ncbi:sulfate/molybdate ABC transporter ATP-binding protein [Adlercreutzia sp. ZJ138]|uniref:sulfate/molybdate ABC transporter ATP-binding protein n=1 Tax=Adlercreutzia sp. ZJ138 TaxID=2709405 RepID=UPI0013EAB593|nr:ATP-binding cassette domain-containing protein [Adlercreutzia sp. ZJ138]
MSLEVSIKKRFSGFKLDVNFQAGSETLGFLGASGCGKSLTMRCIAGIETPDEGRIVVNDQVFFEREAGKKPRVNLTPQERKTALLFQNYMLFPNLTVEQNVAAGIPKSESADTRMRMVSEQLRRFGLVGLEKRYPAQLSGGQQQRVALARMLAARPGILMLDEPFSALDAHLKSSLEQNLIGLFEEFNGTILYVSHDIDEAFRFCDRIAVVEAGHISEIGPKHDIVSNPESLAAIKLSGCKNTTPAEYVSDHEVCLPEWGIRLSTEQIVPRNVRYFGVRAFHLRKAREMGPNVFRMRADRVSDSRFERTVMLSFLDAEVGPQLQKDLAEEDETMKFLKLHIQWKVDKLSVSEDELPAQGDELLIEIPSSSMYLVTK